MALEESERLLDALWTDATRPELTWCQLWRVGASRSPKINSGRILGPG
jgi:hypothetical protein